MSRITAPHVDAYALCMAQLLELQDQILQSGRLFLADEVISAIQAALPSDVAMLFYMRAERRFSDAKPSYEPFLRFPFLSFELADGKINRFANPTALAEREAIVVTKRYHSSLSEAAAIYWLPHPIVDEQLLLAVRRVFQTFYQVCGSREHFNESVSRRYVREFLRDHGREVSEYPPFIAQIEAELDLNIALGFQRDQFIHQAPRELAEIVHLVPGSTVLVEALAGEPRFVTDLETSLSKKTTNFGRAGNLPIYYCITTLTDEHFLRPQDGAQLDFKIARRAVLIFLSQRERLQLAAVNNATRLIDSALRERQTASREDPFFEVLQECRRSEEALASAPCATLAELDKVAVRLLEPFLRKIVNPTSLADQILLRRYDPGTDTLDRLVDTVPEATSTAEASVSIRHQRSAAAQSFSRDEAIWQPHRRHFAERQLNIADRKDLGNSAGDDADAFHVRPIRFGSVPSAVIEFSSGRVGSLKSEAGYFERVATMCGEVIRRVELANDRAWLSRMSYVHAMRHRIESIIRQIEEQAGEPASELRSVLTSYSVRNAAEYSASCAATMSAEALKSRLRGGLTPEAELVCEAIAAACEANHAPERTFGLIGDILETLISNASHAPVDLADLKVEVLPGVDGPATLKLAYLPQSGILTLDRLSQVCVSPIRDHVSNTYHFGLFLLSAQLRMVGGAAQAARGSDMGLGNTYFGATFMVPLGGPGDEAD